MVNWTAEKDQTLLRGVFQFCDIKMSKDLLEHLAGIIGEGCTPKAVNHRLTNIKNTGKPVRDPNDQTKSTPAKEKSSKSTPVKSPGSGRGRGRPKKTVNKDVEPTNNRSASPSPSAGRKRGSTSEVTEGTTQNKKIKKEQVDEESFQDAATEVADEI